MTSSQDTQPRHRSAFAAAFLSLLFPGLGHAYAGAYARALGFAAAPILLLSLGAGIGLRADRLQVLAFLLQNLDGIQVLNLLILLYRIAAAVDAYRVATYINAFEASSGGRLGRPRIIVNPLSAAGLLAVLIVMSGVHVVVAYYDAQAKDLVGCIFDETGTAQCENAASPSPGASDPTGPSESTADTPPGGSAPPGATAAPAGTIKPWTGNERLNILLVGVDQRPKERTFNTDTLIVVSVDPRTRQVAMFSLPRDTVQVPLAPGPARSVFGSTYQGKINSLYSAAQNRPDLFPGNNAQRGYRALKDTLGYLYGLDIQYYAEVNFDGFRQVVDSVGGVTINVQFPVLDDYYPSDNGQIRVYIPAGIQHMTGTQALVYARSRHSSIDYDRSARQQRVLVSLKDQTDVGALIPKVPDLVKALKSTVHTDIPISQLGPMLALAGSVDSANIRSYVFAPPLYGQRVSTVFGDSNTVDLGRVRQAVQAAFRGGATDEDQKEKIALEQASVWVLNGSGDTGQAAAVAAYLEYWGVAASAPKQTPVASSRTKIVVYNGAENDAPQTIAFLEQLFGVHASLKNDPSARADIVITTGRSTPDLTPPPGP